MCSGRPARSFLDSNGDALERISSFSSLSVWLWFFFLCTGSVRWLRHSMIRSSRSQLVWRCGYWWCPCSLSSCGGGVVCCCSCLRYYQGGTVRTYLIPLRPKPSVCHGPKVSTLHHLDICVFDRPTGSLEAGTWAFIIALHIMSLTIAWPVCFVSHCLHARPCRPRGQLGCHTRMYEVTCVGS